MLLEMYTKSATEQAGMLRLKGGLVPWQGQLHGVCVGGVPPEVS